LEQSQHIRSAIVSRHVHAEPYFLKQLNNKTKYWN